MILLNHSLPTHINEKLASARYHNFKVPIVMVVSLANSFGLRDSRFWFYHEVDKIQNKSTIFYGSDYGEDYIRRNAPR